MLILFIKSSKYLDESRPREGISFNTLIYQSLKRLWAPSWNFRSLVLIEYR
jgi:hypothetical protein